MRTLVIYDVTGYLIQVMSGNVREPVGIPFVWVEVPAGKYVERVDVSGEQHEVMLMDIPKTPEQLQIEALQAKQQASDIAIAELTMLLLTPQL